MALVSMAMLLNLTMPPRKCRTSSWLVFEALSEGTGSEVVPCWFSSAVGQCCFFHWVLENRGREHSPGAKNGVCHVNSAAGIVDMHLIIQPQMQL